MIIELVSYKPDSYKKNVIYKRYIISKDDKRKFKSVKTRGYKVWQNGITKCVRLVDYKVWQNGLQSALGITKCGKVDCKVHQGLQSVGELQSELVHL